MCSSLWLGSCCALSVLADVTTAFIMRSFKSNELELNKHNLCHVMLNAFLSSLCWPLLRIAVVHEVAPRAIVGFFFFIYIEVSGLGGNKFKCFLLSCLNPQWSLIQPVWIVWEYVKEAEWSRNSYLPPGGARRFLYTKTNCFTDSPSGKCK